MNLLRIVNITTKPGVYFRQHIVWLCSGQGCFTMDNDIEQLILEGGLSEFFTCIAWCTSLISYTRVETCYEFCLNIKTIFPGIWIPVINTRRLWNCLICMNVPWSLTYNRWLLSVLEWNIVLSDLNYDELVMNQSWISPEKYLQTLSSFLACQTVTQTTLGSHQQTTGDMCGG